jgi:hypothetical protein
MSCHERERKLEYISDDIAKSCGCTALASFQAKDFQLGIHVRFYDPKCFT